MKSFRTFIKFLMVVLVAASVAAFFYTDRLSKKLVEVKGTAELMYSQWEMRNDCLESPKNCDDSDYSKQFKGWLSQFEQYKVSKEQTPQFKFYQFLKELDELYVPDLNSGGLAALGAGCALLILFCLLIIYLSGSKKKVSAPKYDKPVKREFAPKSRANQVASTKPDTQALLSKAARCADSEPAQAISYLEQALEGSLSIKLSVPALLLCGSLRLKNKIGEEQGKKQLQRVILLSPQSQEGKKAQIALDTFK